MSGFTSKRILLLIVPTVIFPILPVILFSHLPLLDYPNHLAELEIRKALPSNPHLANFYQFSWKIIPNMALDLLATPFLRSLDVEIIGRLIIIYTFILICTAGILLDQELNQENWGLSLFSGLLLYNGPFMDGFINYIVGIGIAILFFWIWVRYRDKCIGGRIVIFTVLGAIVCMMHFWAFLLYGLCIAGYECPIFWEKLAIEPRVRVRTSLFKIPVTAAISLLVPLMAVIYLSPSRDYEQPTWGPPWGARTVWDLVKWKAEGLASPIFTRQIPFEKPLLVAILAIFVLSLATRMMVVKSRMLIPLAACGAVFIVMPNGLAGSLYDDYRLPAGIAFFALARIGWRKTSGPRIRVVRLLLSICVLFRVGSVLSAWSTAQPIIAEYDTALQLVPPGSRLLVLNNSYGMLFHVPVLAAAKQRVFVPYTFTNDTGPRGIQLLDLMPSYRDYARDFSTGLPYINDLRR